MERRHNLHRDQWLPPNPSPSLIKNSKRSIQFRLIIRLTFWLSQQIVTKVLPIQGIFRNDPTKPLVLLWKVACPEMTWSCDHARPPHCQRGALQNHFSLKSYNLYGFFSTCRLIVSFFILYCIKIFQNSQSLLLKNPLSCEVFAIF